MKRRKQHIDIDLYKKIIDEIKTFGTEFEMLEPQMWGEPLLHPEISKILELSVPLKEKFKVRLSTNALLLDERRTELILKYPPTALRISLDAFYEDTYNKIRCGGDFKTATENTAKFLKSKGKGTQPITSVQLIENNFNQKEIGKFKKKWEGLADKVSVIRLCSMSDEKQYNIMKVNENVNWPYPCAMTWNRMFIYSNGIVPFCGFDVDGNIKMGDVGKQTIRRIWNSKEAFSVRDAFRRNALPPECLTCFEADINGCYSWKYLAKKMLRKVVKT